jgi:hypothetical protein
MSVYSIRNNPEGDEGWFVHRTGLYFAGDNVYVCRKHAGMLLQPVTTLDVEHAGSEPTCFLCKGGPMHGLKFRMRRVVRGPIWGNPVTNPKYEAAFDQAVEWVQAGLVFKGYCPVCGEVMLNDQKGCDPRGAAGERAEAHISNENGNSMSICFGCLNDGHMYERACRMLK